MVIKFQIILDELKFVLAIGTIEFLLYTSQICLLCPLPQYAVLNFTENYVDIIGKIVYKPGTFCSRAFYWRVLEGTYQMGIFLELGQAWL